MRGDIAQEICGVRMGCAGRAMEGCGCAARPERNADGARGADEVCGERVQIGRRAKRGAGFGRLRRGGKGDGGRKMGI